MNNVILIGRLTKDPEIKYTRDQTAVATFTVAINRGKDKNGEDRGADFPRVVAYGRTAENCERYLAKGRLVGIQGRLQTGSYENKDGYTVYTTDIIADRVEFLEWGDRNEGGGGYQNQGCSQQQPSRQEPADTDMGVPEGFRALQDDDIPF